MKDSNITYSTAKVLGNISKLYAGYEVKIRELAKEYAAEALAWFVANQLDAGLQSRGAFWTNRTGRAAENWYARMFSVGNNIGFFARHGTATWYANALEDWVISRQGSTSVETVVRMFAPKFFNEVAEMITGQSGMFDYMYGEFGIDEGGSFGYTEEDE